jgi:cysteinyl-tRNA synthetase
MFQDVLRRYLKFKGFDVFHVMNITDVEDKIIANARAQSSTIAEYTRPFERAFLDDMETLRIQKPELMPKATDHIDEMIRLVGELKDKGYTYESNGSTYFRIQQFTGYGKLSGLSDPETQAGSAVDDDEYSKENPRDFVLWKARREDEHYWDSPFGPGRPGWHLECSAMSMKYLGESFDIHCGGIDLVFPHHENEIAQSEASTGAPFVRHWVHGAHLIVEGQKMSKSLGNFFTLRDLLDRGCNPLALRYLLASVHYRKQLNFTFASVDQSRAAIQRVNDFLLRVREIPDAAAGDTQLGDRVEAAVRGFEEAMDNDLNTSAALAAVFELIRDVNIVLEKGEVGAGDRDRILDFFRGVDKIFDVFQTGEETLEDNEILLLIDERIEARKRKDFERADEIRNLLTKKGIVLEDTREGTRWKRRS